MDVEVHCRPEAVEVRVVDDGAAVVRHGAAVLGTGHGLTGMQERVALVGGTLTVGPRDGGGWMVHAVLPLGGA